MIVGAGTGSGKTLAFYLPAFAAIASAALPGRFQVHTLALYPRKELLRDQLRDAVAAALAVAGVLEKAGRRRIRIGALYGDTPVNGQDWRLRGGAIPGLAAHGDDLICPYLSCPECGKDLIWSRADRMRGVDRLRCVSCGLTLDGDIALTRESLRARPPDLLFHHHRDAQPECLRSRPGQPARLAGRRAARAGPARRGPHLLRSAWRPGRPAAAPLAGQRAQPGDIRRAQRYLAGRRLVLRPTDRARTRRPSTTSSPGRKTGCGGPRVRHRAPGRPRLRARACCRPRFRLRCCVGRILDPPGHEYLHGSTGFIFTDDLDVTNRFYDDLRDAEGGQGRRRRRGRSGRVLAGLRSPDAPFSAERYLDGQSWDLVQRIGWPLDAQASAGELRIGRTSSQDAGVDRDADLVVATASLEVGYNDPRVGLVLQHKAPHDAAAFIQRRGRAGRIRGTRPWTVVALSDYGRDRLAYQAYENALRAGDSAEEPACRKPLRAQDPGHAGSAGLAGKHSSRPPGKRVTRGSCSGRPAGNGRPDRARSQAMIGLLEAVLSEPFATGRPRRASAPRTGDQRR